MTSSVELVDALRLLAATGQGVPVDTALLRRAESLLSQDDRVPQDLRGTLAAADGVELAHVAEALLAVLGEAESLGELMAGAIRSEGGIPELRAPDAGWARVSDRLAQGLERSARAVDVAEEVEQATSRVPEAPSREQIATAVRQEAGRVELAAAVMDALGARSLHVGEAVAREAGRVELADPIAQSLGAPRLPVAAAVRAEAGRVELADAVCTEIRLEEPLASGARILAAVREGSGRVEVVEAVLGSLQVPCLPVAAAVRAESGEVGLAASVMALIGPEWTSVLLDNELSPSARRLATRRLLEQPEVRLRLTDFASVGRAVREAVALHGGAAPQLWPEVAEAIGSDPEALPELDGAQVAAAVRAEIEPVDVSAAVMERIRRSAVAPVNVEPPVSANRLGWAGLVLAAVALLAIFGWPSAPEPVAEPVAASAEAEPILFAHAGEVTVDALDYAADTNVHLIQDEDGPLIIWFEEDDEGATL